MVAPDIRKWGANVKRAAETESSSGQRRRLSRGQKTGSTSLNSTFLYGKFPVETPVTAMDLEVFAFFSFFGKQKDKIPILLIKKPRDGVHTTTQLADLCHPEPVDFVLSGHFKCCRSFKIHVIQQPGYSTRMCFEIHICCHHNDPPLLCNQYRVNSS